MQRLGHDDADHPEALQRQETAAVIAGSEDLLTGLPEYLGIRTVEVGTARMVAELEVRPELLNPFGSAHGGVVAGPGRPCPRLGAVPGDRTRSLGGDRPSSR